MDGLTVHHQAVVELIDALLPNLLQDRLTVKAALVLGPVLRSNCPFPVSKALAEEVVRLCEEPNAFEFCYEADTTIMEKLNAIATKIYRADGVQLVGNAVKQIKQLEELGFSNMPICMAKTQYSFSDDQKKLGAPRNFTIQVRNLKVSAGAGFIVALTGDIMTMAGLPKVPAAEKIDVDENGVIHGLF
jgi:formate--tetrahydrofolate ligase